MKKSLLTSCLFMIILLAVLVAVAWSLSSNRCCS
jgi:hypothetical protein